MTKPWQTCALALTMSGCVLSPPDSEERVSVAKAAPKDVCAENGFYAANGGDQVRFVALVFDTVDTPRGEALRMQALLEVTRKKKTSLCYVSPDGLTAWTENYLKALDETKSLQVLSAIGRSLKQIAIATIVIGKIVGSPSETEPSPPFPEPDDAPYRHRGQKPASSPDAKTITSASPKQDMLAKWPQPALG